MAGISNLPDETNFHDSDLDLSSSLEGLEQRGLISGQMVLTQLYGTY